MKSQFVCGRGLLLAWIAITLQCSLAESVAVDGGNSNALRNDQQKRLSGKCGPNCTWEYDSSAANRLIFSGSGEIQGFTQSPRELPWYGLLSTIYSVRIEKGITSIGYGAFFNSTQMRGAVVSDTVTSIGNYSFAYSPLFYYVSLPAVTTVKDYAFYGCTNLHNLELSNDLTDIGIGAFSGCDFLSSVQLPNSLNSIGDSAFEVSGLTSIAIPDSVTSLGMKAFSGCYALKSVSLGKGLTEVKFGTFSGCERLQSVSFSDSLIDIGMSAFNDCELLESVTIPASVSSIGGFAFAGCTSLTHVCYEGKSDPAHGEDNQAFSKCTSLGQINVLESVYEDNTFCGKPVSKGETCLKKSSDSSFTEYSSLASSTPSTHTKSESQNYDGAKLASKPNEFFIMFVVLLTAAVFSYHL